MVNEKENFLIYFYLCFFSRKGDCIDAAVVLRSTIGQRVAVLNMASVTISLKYFERFLKIEF